MFTTLPEILPEELARVFSFMGFYGRPTTNTNVRVSGNTVHNCTGTATSKNWTGSGIVVAETTGGVIENNIAYDSGANNTHCGGPAGIWAYDLNNLTFQYNEAYRMKTNKAGGGCDGHGFDLDGGMRNSVMQYNWSHDNIGSGFLADAYYEEVSKSGLTMSLDLTSARIIAKASLISLRPVLERDLVFTTTLSIMITVMILSVQLTPDQ